MATTRIQLIPFLISTAVVSLTEMLVRLPPAPTRALLILGGIRAAEAALILFVVFRYHHRLSPVGLEPGTLIPGLIRGLIWSAGFGVAAAACMAAFLVFNVDAFGVVRMSFPVHGAGLAAFYLTGGIIGPIAEEIFFRGVVFGFFRRWGFWVAVCISTGLFVAAHLSGTRIPVTQLAGGVVFAVAYEKTGSLMAPVMIHILGNLSIFTLALVV